MTTPPAKLTRSLYNQQKWDVFRHLTYSPDLALSDCHVIPSLQPDLGGPHFAMEENLQSAVAKFFAKQGTEWYSGGIHKLSSRYNKYLKEEGDYAESRKFLEESNKRCLEALSFFMFSEQSDLTFETFPI